MTLEWFGSPSHLDGTVAIKEPRTDKRGQPKTREVPNSGSAPHPMAVNSEALITVIWADALKAPEQKRHCEMS